MTTKDKITKAKVQLILSEPFFATIMLSLLFVEDSTIKTACTDGKELRYNPAFVDSLETEQIKGLIAHEVMHVTNLHHTRRAGRDPEQWNIAADHAINNLLTASGFQLPAGGCNDPQFKDMSAEDIFKRLPPPPPKNDKGKGEGDGSGKNPGAGDPGGDGGVKDAPAKSASELQQVEAEAKQLIAQAAQVAKQQGKLPAHLQRLVDEMLTPIVDWKNELSSFLTQIARNDYSFSKPSKRYLSQGLYLPSLHSIEKGKFVLMVDTSGSIDKTLLNQFAGEMQSILSECAESITVMFIDADLQRVQEFESDESLDLNPKGGGGTDFKPGFEYMDKEGIEAAAVIYFTDGFCNSFPEDPGYPVLWAIHDNKTFAPPFGEKINL